MIRLKNVSKFYYSKGVIASGFTKINLEFKIGEFVAITGESGSGKSTLLNVLSGLDTYEEGEMYVNGEETSHYIEKDWEDYRRKNIGNIYQNFNLINSYSVYHNIELALTLNGVSKKERKEKVLSLLKRVNMMKYKNTKVSKLSGGQKQRVAIARALAKDVPVIIADEPTGNLDKTAASNVFELLQEISKDKLVIVVTHNYDQVEPYATRKITMHDGKVIEDQKIKETPEVGEIKEVEYGNLKLFDKIKLGIMNTFNVFSKFILLFAVYAFLVNALMSDYSTFKKAEYEMSKMGINYIFLDTNDHRVIMNKKDKTVFSEEEIEKIKKLSNIDFVIKNDSLVDTSISWTSKDEQLWFSGVVDSNQNIRKEISVGRMPEAPNEIVIQGSKSDYYLNYEKDKVLNQVFYRVSIKGEVEKQKEYTVVGIIYDDTNLLAIADHRFYVSEEALNDFQFITHETNSTITIDFMGTNHVSNQYSSEFRLVPNNWVTPGTLIVPEDFNYLCEKNNCIGKNVTITAKNIYFEDTRTYPIEKLYNKKNITYTLDVPNYKKEAFEEIYNGSIYINPLDYNQLFNKGTYQMSIYVKDIEKIDDTVNNLEKMGYHTLKEKDTLAQTGFVEMVRLFKVVVTIVLIIVLFFISYFIIKLILKSRNIYYAILRMLGASKRSCRDLLMIELLTICNLSYFVFVGLVQLNRIKQYIKWDLLNSVQTYFKLEDYTNLYIILIGMSILIAIRYARKLFKTSAMETYREEV